MMMGLIIGDIMLMDIIEKDIIKKDLIVKIFTKMGQNMIMMGMI